MSDADASKSRRASPSDHLGTPKGIRRRESAGHPLSKPGESPPRTLGVGREGAWSPSVRGVVGRGPAPFRVVQDGGVEKPDELDDDLRVLSLLADDAAMGKRLAEIQRRVEAAQGGDEQAALAAAESLDELHTLVKRLLGTADGALEALPRVLGRLPEIDE